MRAFQTFGDEILRPGAPRKETRSPWLGFHPGNVDNEQRSSAIVLCAARGDFVLRLVNQKFGRRIEIRILAAEPIAELLQAKTPIGSSREILAWPDRTL